MDATCPGCGAPVGKYWLKKRGTCPNCGLILRPEVVAQNEVSNNKSD